MNFEQKKLEKTCTFYVSDFHLSTMLLPYISEKIENGTKVIGAFEYNLEDSVDMLLSRLNLSKKKKRELKKVNFRNVEKIDKNRIKNQIIKAKEENVIIIVNGKEKYIDLMNKYVEEISKECDKKIKIINCYQMEWSCYMMKDVIDKHDLVLNTSGENEREVFIKSI